MSRGDRAAMLTVAMLGTWAAVGVNVVVWVGLWVTGVVPFNTLTFWLSLWPVLIDLVILMATLVQARAMAKALEALDELVRQGQQEHAEIRDGVEDIAEALGVDGTEVDVPGGD